MPFSYKPLFLLEGEAVFVFEIKALDVQSDNPAEVYFWFRFDKAHHTLDKLEFVSMHQDGAEQQRAFRQGHLHFSPSGGTYTPTGAAAPVTLRSQEAPSTLPAEVDEAVQRYFVGA